MINIHNGDVGAAAARRASLPGSHMALRESLISGPVRMPYDVEQRAHVLADMAGQSLLRVRNDLLDQERAIAAAMDQDEIVLWFEHDLFCLVHLLFLLTRLAAHRRLTLVFHPEPLSQQELPALMDSRAAVTPAMIALAREAWAAYTSPDPTALNRLLATPAPAAFPFLQAGLSLHASRFPSTSNGLGEIERRALASLAEGPLDFGTLFSRIDAAPPRFGFGDAEVIRILRWMASRAVPLVTIAEGEGTPPKMLLSITPAGENVMSGQLDDIKVTDTDLWLGGVHLTQGDMWRWDGVRKEIVKG
jgi:hypothetical protein